MKLKVNSKEYKPVDLDLEDHKTQLAKARKLLERVEKDLNWYKEMKKEPTLTVRKEQVYIVATVHDSVGALSWTRFEIREPLEEEYSKKYSHAPKLGKMLYLQHYEGLHKPYDQLKKKCFDLMNKIDPKSEIEIEP